MNNVIAKLYCEAEGIMPYAMECANKTFYSTRRSKNHVLVSSYVFVQHLFDGYSLRPTSDVSVTPPTAPFDGPLRRPLQRLLCHPLITISDPSTKISTIRADFVKTYSDAKFFVIKSYSEDDVHKSIKYNVWESTSNGNQKLDTAYQEAKEKSSNSPVFLFFCQHKRPVCWTC